MDDETPLAKIIEAQLIGSAKCAAERGRKPTWGELARDVAGLPEVADNRIASRLEADEDDVERVARAICEAEGGQWRERTEKPAVGMPHYYNFDRLNNHWRHKARAAILAMRRAAQE